MGRTTQSPELYVSTVSPHWKCNLILYTSQACLPRLPGPVPIQYSTPHTLPSAVTSETWKMSSPYSNLSTEVQTAITELESDSSTYQPQNANELLKIVDSVQIFFVTGDGHVSTFSAPETLRIFKFQEDQEDSTTSFLQVGGWTHPLIPGASPCLQAENGAIMFPGGLIGYGTVYNGLETSSKVLGANVKENSVKVVSHKYGGEAGNVFGEACTAAGNAAMTYMNVQSLGVKGLVKKTAKQTGKNVVKNVLTDSSGKSVTTKQ